MGCCCDGGGQVRARDLIVVAAITLIVTALSLQFNGDRQHDFPLFMLAMFGVTANLFFVWSRRPWRKP